MQRSVQVQDQFANQKMMNKTQIKSNPFKIVLKRQTWHDRNPRRTINAFIDTGSSSPQHQLHESLIHYNRGSIDSSYSMVGSNSPCNNVGGTRNTRNEKYITPRHLSYLQAKSASIREQLESSTEQPQHPKLCNVSSNALWNS